MEDKDNYAAENIFWVPPQARWEDGERYDRTLPLTQVDRLMPHHNHILPEKIVSTPNKMQQRVEQDETLFYDIYFKEVKNPLRVNDWVG
ncbi:hypothetical protein ACLS0F_03170 [Avibacterium endocarditidis]|uniref:hypothetical protein n=1 Tax=Avibacterium endocarditidis TaxID=380674 RepID=UPI001FE2CFA2|nr:hypothetical protein [Avibacterium endocarditidis]